MKWRKNRALSQRVAQAKARVERLGGAVFIDPDVPEEVVEAFLSEIDDCPLCREREEQKDALTIDH